MNDAAMLVADIAWMSAIEMAKRGVVGPIVGALRSNLPIPAELERSARNAIATLLVSRPRRRGRPPSYQNLSRATVRKARASTLCWQVEQMRDELRTAGKSATLQAALGEVAARRGISVVSATREYKRARALINVGGKK